MAEKKKRHIDDYISEIKGRPTGDHIKDIDAYEKWIHKDHVAHFSANILDPIFYGDKNKGVTGVYHAARSKIDELFKDGKAKLKGKKKEIRQILTEYMKEFFNNTNTHVLDVVSQIKDEEEAFKMLAHYFDQEVMAGERGPDGNVIVSMSGLDKELAENEEITVDELKSEIKKWVSQHHYGHHYIVNARKKNLYIDHLPQGLYAKHLMKQLEKEGFEFKSDKYKAQFLIDPSIQHQIHHDLVHKDYGGFKKEYGLVKKKKEE